MASDRWNPSEDSALAKKLFIHMGTAKTGTTSIQLWFERHREALKVRGLLYPKIIHRGDQRASFNNAQHILAFRWGQGWFNYERQITNDAWENFIEQAASWEENVLISSETFALVASVKADELIDLVARRLPDTEIIPIIYFREHSALLRSDAFENLRNSSSGRSILSHMLNPPGYLVDLLQYRRIVENLSNDHRVSMVHVRPFDNASFRGGTLLSDFTKIIGLSDAIDLREQPVVNQFEDTNAMRIILEAICGLPFSDPRSLKLAAYRIAQKVPDSSGRFRWPCELLTLVTERFRDDVGFLDSRAGGKFFQSTEDCAAAAYEPGPLENSIAVSMFDEIVGRPASSSTYIGILQDLLVHESTKSARQLFGVL